MRFVLSWRRLDHKKIVLVVEYLVNLKIAILSTSKGATSAPFTDDNSLVGLFEGDDGETSPNFANQYIFGRYTSLHSQSHEPISIQKWFPGYLCAKCARAIYRLRVGEPIQD